MKAASILFSLASLAALPVMATPTVGSSLGIGPANFDLLADVRFCNFIVSGAGNEVYLQNTTGTADNSTGTAGNIAGWAAHNDFTITYVPGTAPMVSLSLVGKNGNTTAYSVNLSRTPDGVTAGPVNYIDFSFMDRMSGQNNTFPTIPNVKISSLDGTDLGSFSLSGMGTTQWGIIDPGGATLSNGFTLVGSFDINLAGLVGQTSGTDRIQFDIGYNSLVPAQILGSNLNVLVDEVPDAAATASLLGISMLALFGLRRKVAA